MKTAAAILFLAFCGIVSATPFQRQNEPCTVTEPAAALETLSRCGIDLSANARTCSENCGGFLCTYFRNNSATFPPSCRANVVEQCSLAGQNIPSTCGALALALVQGVMVAVLLLAVFFML